MMGLRYNAQRGDFKVSDYSQAKIILTDKSLTILMDPSGNICIHIYVYAYVCVCLYMFMYVYVYMAILKCLIIHKQKLYFQIKV
jgi:hypothetical protein